MGFFYCMAWFLRTWLSALQSVLILFYSILKFVQKLKCKLKVESAVKVQAYYRAIKFESTGFDVRKRERKERRRVKWDWIEICGK